ncbi:MAG: hypothetical protein J5930_11175 [Treponema sp.]|nr:hypothetical protein [Treponema sp.]
MRTPYLDALRRVLVIRAEGSISRCRLKRCCESASSVGDFVCRHLPGRRGNL